MSSELDAQLESDPRVLAESLPHIVWHANAIAENDYFNAAWYEYTGLQASESLGRGWFRALHPDDATNAIDAWERAAAAIETYATELRLRRSDGVYHWFLTRAQPVREGDDVGGWWGTFTDISEIHHAAARDTFLARAEALFGSELDSTAIMRAVAESAVDSFADYVLFDLVDESGMLRRTAVDHKDAARRPSFQRSIGETPPIDHPIHPIATAWRSGESVLIPHIDASWWALAKSSDAHYARMRDAKLSSLITVVIEARGQRYGVLTFCRGSGSPDYGDADLSTAEDLSRRIGAALENARLYREARAAAEAQRRIAEREGFYARLSEGLTETLDLRETLDAATKLLVPIFADWAVVNLTDEDGQLFLAASHHHDPRRNRKTRRLLNLRYLGAEATSGSPLVVRTKRPLLYENVPSGGIGAVTGQYRTAVRSLGVTSAAIVPLSFRGVVRGTVALMYDRTSGRRYVPDDLPFFVEIARRLSPAIGNAEAYERERRVARTFQAAALTTELPRVAGTSFDALYEAGRSEALIGGDWYDAFRVADGRVVLSVGDVAGSGLDAAATMASIRQSLRGAAAINPNPSVMLDAADRVLRSQAPDRFVTAWVGVIDLVWATVACAGAGHPAPLARYADGRIVELPAGGLPLGLRERGQDDTFDVELPAHTTLLLYTDGLIEASHDVIAGMSAVESALGAASVDAAPARAIHQAVLNGAEASDDVALLVVAFRESLLSLGGDHGARHWTFDADDGSAAATVRREIVGALARRNVSEGDRIMAELIYAELVGNVKRYAPGLLDVALDLSADHAVLHVIDSGPGFQHNARLPADALAESGRGLFIVSSIVDEFAVTRNIGGGAHARAVLKGALN